MIRKEGRYLLGTVREVAHYLISACTDNFDTYWEEENKFKGCDFMVAYDYNSNETLEDIVQNNSGWYGIKSIDAGFDSNDTVLISDYYGGGCVSTGVFIDGEELVSCEDTVVDMITQTLSVSEVYYKEETVLIVDLEPENYPKIR